MRVSGALRECSWTWVSAALLALALRRDSGTLKVPWALRGRPQTLNFGPLIFGRQEVWNGGVKRPFYVGPIQAVAWG